MILAAGNSTDSPLPLTAAVMSAVAAVGSAVAATVAVRSQRRWSASDAFIRLSTQFETPQFREYRRRIYTLDRGSYATWTDAENEAVNAWCAHLDLMSVLLRSGQLDLAAFLDLYGDVVLRTIYQISPYCNHQIDIRGRQFLLPLRLLTSELVALWRRQAKRKRYPLIIGFPSQPQLRVTPDLFDSDPEVVRFRVDKRLT